MSAAAWERGGHHSYCKSALRLATRADSGVEKSVAWNQQGHKWARIGISWEERGGLICRKDGRQRSDIRYDVSSRNYALFSIVMSVSAASFSACHAPERHAQRAMLKHVSFLALAQD